MLTWRANLAAVPGFLALALLFLPYALLCRSALGVSLADGVWLWSTFDGKSLAAIGTSLALSAAVAALSVVLAVLVLAALSHVLCRGWVWTVLGAVALDFCLSPVIHLVAWRELTGAEQLPGFLAAVVVLSWKYFPLALAVLLLGLHALDASGIEAGRVFSRRGEALRHLVFPQVLPAISAAATIILVLVFGEAEVPPLLGMRVYAEEFMAHLALEPDIGRALPAALPFVVAALAGWGLTVRSVAGYSVLAWDRSALKPLSTYAQVVPHPRILAVVLFVLVCAPVLLLAFAALPGGFVQFFPKHGQALATSALLGVLSTALAIAIGGMVSALSAAAGAVLRRTVLSLLLLGLFMPGALTGLGMVALSQSPGFDWLNTGDILLVATHTLRLLPVAALLLIGLALLEPQRWAEEVRLLGIPCWPRWRFIHAPLRWPRWLLICGVLMALALSELSSTILVVAPGTETAVLRLYNLMHFGSPESVAALGFSQAGLVVAILAAVAAVANGRSSHAGA